MSSYSLTVGGAHHNLAVAAIRVNIWKYLNALKIVYELVHRW